MRCPPSGCGDCQIPLDRYEPIVDQQSHNAPGDATLRHGLQMSPESLWNGIEGLR